MPSLPSRSRLAALASMLIGAILLPRLAGWAEPDRILELSGFVLAAMLTGCLRVREPIASDRGIMPPAFVLIFSSLMLFGPHVAMFVAAVATLTPGVVAARTPRSQVLIDTAIVIAATQSAGLAQQWVASVPGIFVWPWLAVPISAALVAYHVVQGALANVVVPLVARRPVNRSWPTRPLTGFPVYVLGACVAGALVEIIDRRMWNIAPVAAVSLFFAYRTYADYVRRLEDHHRRREVIDHLEQGMALLDCHGRVTLWNDALARMLSCSGDRALGRLFIDAVPALAGTELPRAVSETVADRKGRTLKHLTLPAGAGTRIVEVKVLPVAAGVALLWHDVTQRAQAEREISRSGERLSLAAEGANDGLWQWNLQTQEFYVSGRWRAMVGLPAHSPVLGPRE